MSDMAQLTKILHSEVREKAAARIQVASDFTMPDMQYWNYDPCEKHEPDGKPKYGCRKCAILLLKHQRVGSSWMYLRKRALLADSVGLGKTAHAAAVIAMMKESGEIDKNHRVVVVCRSPAVLQWEDELNRMLPEIRVMVAQGRNQRDRVNRYVQHWEVVVIGAQTFLRDYELFDNFNISAVFVDDVDALMSKKNKTNYALNRIAKKTPRYVVMTGTPLHKRLHQMWAILEPLGGIDVLGSQYKFEHRYVRSETVEFWVKTPNGSKKRSANKIVGYKNMEEFKEKIAPMVLRRTSDDVDDVDLPDIIPNNVYLDLYPAQRRKYDELRKGVLSILKEGKSEQIKTQAIGKIHYGAKICAGLAALGEPDGPETSVKMDWLMEKIANDGDLGEEKVVIFAGYKDTIKALQKRLEVADIGYETIWGNQPDKIIRKASQDRFWDDPKCRVLIGTQAIEQSLNLQCSRHLINIDMILNPARMEQLSGRIRRQGSVYKHVYVHNLLTLKTQEEGYLSALEKEQALIDYVWDENSQLFESLTPLALMNLIAA